MANYFGLRISITLLSYVVLLITVETCHGKKGVEIDKEEQEAAKYVAELEKPYSLACNNVTRATWDYMTNVTKTRGEVSANESIKFDHFQAKIQQDIIERFPNWQSFKNESLRREFRKHAFGGPGNMTASELAESANLKSEMQAASSTARVCEYGNPSNCTMRLNPEIARIFSTERDPKILSHYWTAWNDKMSELVPPTTYEKFLGYQSKLARANGFNNMFEMWMVEYDDDTPGFTPDGFRKQMLDLWGEIRPMYEKLHAYVRMQLKKRAEYKDIFGKCGLIPIYLLGNVWSTLEPITKPFPEAPSLDPTEAMKKKNYTVLKMFQEADKFFTNLGLPPMTPTFWNKSMFERPEDGRQVVCHPTAHDMCLGRGSQDFRIKVCGKVNFNQFQLIHHELGHVAYYQQYTHQNLVFRRGGNPGFHEAIGDAIALSVNTPHYLQCELGLELGQDSGICKAKGKEANTSVSESDINYLYMTALTKFPMFPVAISMDSWRWEAFEGKLTPDQYNKRWWELIKTNNGVQPPADRNSPQLFDAAAKYHITADTEFLRYFIAVILQYQFYEAMCIAAGQYDRNGAANKSPLYQCDFSGSKEAGKLLGNMMKLGSSKGWPTALEAIAGTRQMSFAPMKHYFQPLFEHIDKELKKNGEKPGYGGDCN